MFTCASISSGILGRKDTEYGALAKLYEAKSDKPAQQENRKSEIHVLITLQE